MLVGICDFPGSYLFPPIGYGGIERWLWAVAVGARRAGADVHLLGPLWRRELDGWRVDPVRLERLVPGSRELARMRSADYDLIIAGHEYPSLPAWRVAWRELNCDVATFQHSPDFSHPAWAFDGRRSRLYCYSPEMTRRYSAHSPRTELAVHLGLDEDVPLAIAGADLIWLGRIDAQKAPHIAVKAAMLLRRRIRVVGPVFDPDYVAEHRALFAAEPVEMQGEMAGAEKAAALSRGQVFLYTCARQYIEAGAAVFGESLRAGTPVAALAWRRGTCAEAALCEKTGAVAVVDPQASDDEAARALAAAVECAAELKPGSVQEIGQTRFDAVRHFEALAARHADTPR